MPTWLKNLLLKGVSKRFEKKLRMTELSDELIRVLVRQKTLMLSRHSVSDVVQILPWKFPHMMLKRYSLLGRDRLGNPKCDFPIAIAYGDRDFLCSKGADDIVRQSKHFKSGRSQLFKVEDSSHFLH